MFRVIPILCAFSLVPLVSSTGRAEIIYKLNGGKLTGTIDKKKSTPDYVIVKSRFGTFQIPRSDIKSIDYSTQTVEKYEDVAKKHKDTADDQFALALWCIEHRYRKEYTKHLEKAIELDPDHAEARSRLGYRQFGGKWVTEEEFYESQGYVKYKGKWVLPQEKARSERKRQNTKARQEYFRKVRLYQRWLRQDKVDRQAEATRGLLAMEDPVAVQPLFEILGKEGNDEERKLLVEILDKIEGQESTSGLISVALLDRVEVNRAEAVKALLSRKTPSLVQEVAGALKDNDNQTVRNAGALLGEIGDDSVVPALIDALITTHYHVYKPSFVERGNALNGLKFQPRTTVITENGTMIRKSNISPYQVAQNGIGFQPVPEKIVTTEVKKNREVLQALSKITSEDFGYEKDRWKTWVRDHYRDKAAKIVN